MQEQENSDFWHVSGAANGTTEVWIHGYIGESLFSESTSAKDFVNTLSQVKSKKVKVFLNSRGGSVVDGIAIFNALVSHSAEITTVNMGSAMSIAALILQAGDKRLSFGNAITMVHDSSTGMYGNAKDHRKTADVLDKFNALIATTFESKGVSKHDIQAMMDGNDHYYTATEAQDKGLIDEVTDHLSVSASASVDIPFAIPDHLARHSSSALNQQLEHKPQPTLLEKVKAILGAPQSSPPEKPHSKKTQPQKPQSETTEPKSQPNMTSNSNNPETESRNVNDSVLALAAKQQSDVQAFEQRMSAIDAKFTAINDKLNKLSKLTSALSQEPQTNNTRPPATGAEDTVLTDC